MKKIFSWSFHLNSAGKMDSHTLNHYQYEFKLFYVPLTMETIKIELKNKNALSILKSLERAKIIRLVSTESQTKNSPVDFKEAISPDRALELANEIEKSRNEWDERTT